MTCGIRWTRSRLRGWAGIAGGRRREGGGWPELRQSAGPMDERQLCRAWVWSGGAEYVVVQRLRHRVTRVSFRRTLCLEVFPHGVLGPAQVPGDGPQGESLLLGQLHRLPAGLLSRRGTPVQPVGHWLPLAAPAPGGCTLDIGVGSVLVGQVQGSQHPWLEDRRPKPPLLIAVDDATSTLSQAVFRTTGDTRGYLALLDGLIRQWGIPMAVYSDRRAAFKYNARQKPVPVETTRSPWCCGNPCPASTPASLWRRTSPSISRRGRSPHRRFGVQARLLLES